MYIGGAIVTAIVLSRAPKRMDLAA